MALLIVSFITGVLLPDKSVSSAGTVPARVYARRAAARAYNARAFLTRPNIAPRFTFAESPFQNPEESGAREKAGTAGRSRTQLAACRTQAVVARESGFEAFCPVV
jgi:hypothetical protein